ncbi:50S ribosomal protein L6 [Candidatus Woesearchaeota archaeon]|nr:50S ribosomal protein L6 [Candidatus Woesearchaeota archaeon]
MKNNFVKEIPFGEKVTAQIAGTTLKIKGQNGEVERNFNHPKISITIADHKVVISTFRHTKGEKTILGAFASHVKNMVEGVEEPHTYKLKICSGHFPMTVTLGGNELTIKNFFGETIPRKVTLPKGVEVKMSGSDITITSPDIEAAGLAASRIENLCRITKRDIRRFQDGIYITHKPEKR